MHQLQRAHDRREWIAQLMRERCEKVIFRPIFPCEFTVGFFEILRTELRHFCVRLALLDERRQNKEYRRDEDYEEFVGKQLQAETCRNAGMRKDRSFHTEDSHQEHGGRKHARLQPQSYPKKNG